MEMRPITFSIAAVSIAASAGIGAYLAVRHNAAESSVATVAESTAATTAAAAGGAIGSVAVSPAVESTEQLVAADTTSAPPGAALETPPPAVEGVASRTPAPLPTPQRGEARPAGRTAPAAPRPDRPEAPALPPEAPAAPPSRPERPVPSQGPDGPQPDTVSEPEPAAPEPVLVERPTSNPAARGGRELPEIDGWRPVERPSTPPGHGPLASTDVTRLDRASIRVTELDPPRAPAGSAPTVPAAEELVIPADSVIGLQIDTLVTSDRAQVEDDVQARVTRDVLVADRVVFPAGLIVRGSVVAVDRAGKLSGASRLGVRFHAVVLDDGVEVPIATETVFREGRSRGRDNAAKVSGGAVAGAILGAIFGGGRGAAPRQPAAATRSRRRWPREPR